MIHQNGRQFNLAASVPSLRIDVADAVGRQLPRDLLCTSRGGAAVTPTARKQAAAYRVWFDQTSVANIVRPPGNLI